MRTISRRVAILLATAAFTIGIPLGVVIAAAGFNDVSDSNIFKNDIAAIAAAGVTTGCGGGNYCPKDNVTREQMAAFMNRLGALSPEKTPVVNADKLDGLDSTEFVQGRAGGFAYAWADEPAMASYTPDTAYSYNSGGGAIHITRSATGVYAVQFGGLSLSHGVVQVTKYDSGPGECHVVAWLFGIAEVECYDLAGSAADYSFTILYMD